MQEIIRAQLTSVQCENHNIVKHLCCSQQCDKCAFSCGKEECSCCSNIHSNCQFVWASKFIEKIKNRKGQMSNSIQKGVEKIYQIYQDCIQYISRSRETLMLWKQNFGLNANQIKLLELLQQNKKEQITGKFINTIKKDLSNVVDYEKLNINVETIQNLWKHEEIKFNKIFERLSPLESNYLSYRFFWSKQLKHPAIKHNENIMYNDSLTVSQIAISLLQPPIGLKSLKLSWKLKILKITQWVGIGICSLKIAKQNNFVWVNYSTIGHGTYMISHNGYSWSHTNLNDNQQLKGFAFKENDIITVAYDPVNLTLQYTKNNNEGFSRIQLPKNLQSEDYYPCVLVYKAGDSVQLVSNN